MYIVYGLVAKVRVSVRVRILVGLRVRSVGHNDNYKKTKVT